MNSPNSSCSRPPLERHRIVLLISWCLPAILACALHASDTWLEVGTPLLTRLTNSGVRLEWPGGCSGVVVNRTNGDVTIKVVSQGLWRSSDQGQRWQRIDGGTISGRDETGWATSADANAPTRMASFSLDGSAGWTQDGVHWNRFTTLGRNWDFGSVDWAAREPRTIVAAKHETTPPGEVYLSQDAGVTWKLLPIHLSEKRERISMLGALGASTLIYSNGDGIYRSQDAGTTWEKVSHVNPQTRIPILFRGTHYLGSASGLLVSKDLGASWQAQGTSVDICQGPFFGRDERSMLVVGKQGVFQTDDAGENWRRVADLKAKGKGFLFTPNWFGCYAWDPVSRILYASAMGNPVYRLELGSAR